MQRQELGPCVVPSRAALTALGPSPLRGSAVAFSVPAVAGQRQMAEPWHSIVWCTVIQIKSPACESASSRAQDDQQDYQLVNSVYLDNSSMELYHGRLDKRPNAIAVRIRCQPSPTGL